jgi:oxygen-dependent protoporphyrinogen oxidase
VSAADLEDVVEKAVVLPSPVLGHHEIVGEIDRLIAGTRLAITGNYFAGLAIDDCVSRSKQEVSRVATLDSFRRAG